MLIFLTIPVAGIFAWNYNILFRRRIGGFRFINYNKKKDPSFLELRKNYYELISLISNLKDEEK